MGFDLFSRGQWDDFRVWGFAESDVCFVRLVYLMVRAQEPGPRRKPHVYALCVSGHCPGTDSVVENGSAFVSCHFSEIDPLPVAAPIWLPSGPPPVFLCSSKLSRVAGVSWAGDCPPALLGPLCGPFCSGHGGDLPSAAVLASRLTTRLSLPHIPFMGWSPFWTSRTVCEVTQFLLHQEPSLF